MADFVQPPLALFTDDRLTDGDRTVYCLLTSFGDHGTLANCHPSLKTVAARGKRSRTAVARSVAKLVKLGWVAREARVSADGDQDTSSYSFPFHRVVAETVHPVAETHLPSISNGPTGGRSDGTGVVAETAHNLEPSTNSQSPRTSAPVKPTQEVLKLEPPKGKQREKPHHIVQRDEVIDLWNSIDHFHVKPAKPDNRFNRVLAAAHNDDLPALEALLRWAAGSEWHNGLKGAPKLIHEFMANDHLAKLRTARNNASITQQPRQQDNRIAPDNYKEIKW